MIGTFGSNAVASKRYQRSTDTAWASAPVLVEINGLSAALAVIISTVQINDTLGSLTTCQFDLKKTAAVSRPNIGDTVRILYFDFVLFAGIITRVEPVIDTSMADIRYRCTGSDWSYLLMRRRVRRNFVNKGVLEIADSLLDNEAAGDGFTLGAADNGPLLSLVDTKNARVFDVLTQAAAAAGLTILIDPDKRLNFVSVNVPQGPKALTDSTVMESSIIEDMEGYRNVQTIICTGTPQTTTEAALSYIATKQNDDQITERQSVEGGSGRYEEMEEITHPTSNTPTDIALLALAYCDLRLALSGVVRKTLKAKVRGYGFRAGQSVTVNLTGVAQTGTWLIQRASLAELAARELFYDLELVLTSTQLRAYNSWLNIVKAGKVTVQIPSTIGLGGGVLTSYTTPGTFTYIATTTGTIAITIKGASGGGGQGAHVINTGQEFRGGAGGNGGYATRIFSVNVGDQLDIVIGSHGVASPGSGTPATGGGNTTVSKSGVVLCAGNGGGGGSNATGAGDGTNGTPGTGTGDTVLTGGGKTGGAGGYLSAPPGDGLDGEVDIQS
jgi:hypothetical protein